MQVTEVPSNPRGGFDRLFRLDNTNGDDNSLLFLANPTQTFSTLRVVHVNDTHHFHLGEHPANSNGPSPAANIAEYLQALRVTAEATDAEVIYLSAGDEHTGTSLDELLGYIPSNFALSAGYAVQNILGLDAATIGNHDLDRGPQILEMAITTNATFPVLSANITQSGFLRTYAPAIIGVTPRGTRVGIIGVTTDEQLQVRPTQDPDFTVTDPLQAAVTWYGEIESYVDIVIVLSHLGLNVPGSRHRSRVDDRTIAVELSKYRGSASPPLCIIGGHTHTVIDPKTAPVKIHGIPVFQAGANLKHLGVVTISPKAIQGELVEIQSQRNGNEHAPKLPKIEELRKTIMGQLSQAVLQSVTKIRPGHVADPTTTLEERLSGECGIANMITDTLWHHLATMESTPVVVATDASGIQSGIVSSPDTVEDLRIDDLYRILPYADSIYRAMLGPEELLAILRSNARRILPRSSLETCGGPVGLLDWAHIARGFLHFSGNIRYLISGTNDADHATLNGVALDIRIDRRSPPTSLTDHAQDLPKAIAVYCNSFSATGNQGWGLIDDDSFTEFGSVSLPELGFTDTGIPMRVALIEALRREPAISINHDGRLIVSD